MTQEEKKEELIGLFTVGAIYLGDLIDECFEFADAHPNWISVEDELPNKLETVLCTNGHDVKVGFYDSDGCGNVLWAAPCMGCLDITHWMPMPAPPEHIAGVSKMIGSSEKPNNCQQGEEIKGNFGKTSPNKKGCKQ